MADSFVVRLWNGSRRFDQAGWRLFVIALVALALAMLFALYSRAAAEAGEVWLAGVLALLALAISAWVAAAIVPVLARRTPLRWVAYQIDSRLTREGAVYLGGLSVVALAAFNTGNNLLFIILACLLAGIAISGILSRVVLSGIEMKLALPEHIFAGQPIVALAELRNEKQTLPSFSLTLAGDDRATPNQRASQILSRPVYFPYLPRRKSLGQSIEMIFPRRGVYRQDAFSIRTKFPFGFLQKIRKVRSEMEVVVYPSVESGEQFDERLSMVSGEMESFARGRGHDLYSIRDYQPTDSVRHMDWKASAKTGALKLREFTREDEHRVMLVLDPYVEPQDQPGTALSRAEIAEIFERAVTLCACLAWHFYQSASVLEFRGGEFIAPLAPAGEIIYPVLRHLAFVEPLRSGQGHEFLSQLTREPDIFKIILTGQPRNSIPPSLWSSSYILFTQTL